MDKSLIFKFRFRRLGLGLWLLLSSFSSSSFVNGGPVPLGLSKSYYSDLVKYSEEHKCFFPFSVQEGEEEESVRKIDDFCKEEDEGWSKHEPNPNVLKEEEKDKAICIVIGDMLYFVCNKTEREGGKSFTQDKVKLKDPELEVASFCQSLIEDGNVPKTDQVRDEVKEEYGKFLSPGDQRCLSLCGEKEREQVKVHPICIMFKMTSQVWNKFGGGGTDVGGVGGGGQQAVPPPIEAQMGDRGDQKADDEDNQQEVPQTGVKPIDNPNPNPKEKKEEPPKSSSDKSGIKEKESPVLNKPSNSQTIKSSTASSASQNVPGPELAPPVPPMQPEKSSSSPSIPKEDKSKPKPDNNGKKEPGKGTESEDDEKNDPQQNIDKSDADGQNQLQQPKEEDRTKQVFVYNKPDDQEEESSSYLVYFTFFITIIGLCYLLFHNKRRLIAYIIEGKNPRSSRTRRRSATSNSSGASYRRLENNFD